MIRAAQQEILGSPSDAVVVAIGGRGKDFFLKRGYQILSDYLAPPETISFLETRAISKPVIEMYNREEIDEVVMVYTSFVNNMEQKVKVVKLLPFAIERSPDVMKQEKQVEYEPSVEDVFNYLVPKFVEITIYGAIVESATCEHAARRMAMENATENARDMLKDLSLFYNRARQDAITKEIIEVVSGSEAQK